MKRILLMLLSLSLIVCGMTAITSCDKDGGATDGDGDSNTAKKENYTVTVLNSDGSPISNIIVKIMKGEDSQGMKPTSADGKASFELYPDDYTVTLTVTGGESYSYDESALKLTAEKRELTVTLTEKATNTVDLYNDSKAYVITTGSYALDFDTEGLTYFLFIPEVAGRYKFSVSSDVGVSVGYYGNPMIIHDNDLSDEADREEGAVYINVRTYNIGESVESTTTYLIGVKGEAVGSGIFHSERVGDLELSPEEHPWTEYTKTKDIVPFTFEGGALTDIDINDLTVSVVLGEDGYYHYGSAEGPLVYLRLASASKYLVSFEKMAETQYFGHYVNDENGKFLYKITYHTMLLEYIAAAKAGGDAGIYPLTEDLAVMIKDMGAHLGWFTPAEAGSENMLFGTSPITKNAWLFACVYVKEN